MANARSNTNWSCSSFVSSNVTGLTESNVVLGRVTEERHDFLKVLENVGTKSGKTEKTVEIVDNYKLIILLNVKFIIQSQILQLKIIFR